MWNETLFLCLIAGSCLVIVEAARRGITLLTGVIGLFVVLMNLVVLKQVRLFGMEATGADALGIAAGLGINLLREFGSAGAASRAIRQSFLLAALTALVGFLITAFEPSAHDQGHPAIAAVFLPSTRILAASMASFLVCETLEVRWFAQLRERWGGRHLALRHMSSTLLAQALDTVLFSWWGLSGWVEPLWEIALVSYGMKVIAILLSGPFMALAKRILRGPLHAAL